MIILQKTPNYMGLIDWNSGEIDEIESLMVNWGLNCINPKLRTKEKKTLKSMAEIEVFSGTTLHKIKIWSQSKV
jgi:hypothetical protein